MRERRVPGATGLFAWTGTVRTKGCPSRFMLWWAPLMRSTTKPSFSKAATACGPVTVGSLGMDDYPPLHGPSFRLLGRFEPGDTCPLLLVDFDGPLERLDDIRQGFLFAVTLAGDTRELGSHYREAP